LTPILASTDLGNRIVLARRLAATLVSRRGHGAEGHSFRMNDAVAALLLGLVEALVGSADEIGRALTVHGQDGDAPADREVARRLALLIGEGFDLDGGADLLGRGDPTLAIGLGLGGLG